MYRKNILVLFISLFVSILCSCGVINDSAPKRDVYSGETTCSMNTAKLQKILEEDIQEAIDCIEQNFVRVSQQVKIQNGKHIQKNELFKLTTRLLPADGHLIVQKALSLLFKINSIFLKDEADRLSVENIKPFFDIIRVVNKEGVHLNRIFKEINNENNKRSFWRLRAEFIQSVTNISQKSLNIQKDSKKEVSLNIEEFAQELDENLRNTDLKVEKIVSLNFIKKLFLGGDRNILTSTELKELFQKAPDLLTVLFDTYFVKDTDFSHAIEKDRFLLEKVNQIEGLIHQGSEDEILFTIKDLINANEKLLESLKENYVKKYAKTIGTLKINLLTQSIKERDTEDPNKFSLKNIKKIISLAKEYFEIQYFYKLAFNQFEDLMSVPFALTTDVTKDKATYRVINKKMPSSLSDHIFTPEQNNKLWLNFLHIITNNRLYRDKNDLVPFYWDTYKRTKKGLVETAVIRWGLGQLFPKFGYLSPKSMRDNIIPGPKYILDDDRIWTALNSFKQLLQEFRLWTIYPKTFAKNTRLLSDLFQFQSNGDQKIDLDEATDYALLVLAALHMGKKVFDTLDDPRYCSLNAPEQIKAKQDYVTKLNSQLAQIEKEDTYKIKLIQDEISRLDQADENTRSISYWNYLQSRQQFWRKKVDNANSDEIEEIAKKILQYIEKDIKDFDFKYKNKEIKYYDLLIIKKKRAEERFVEKKSDLLRKINTSGNEKVYDIVCYRKHFSNVFLDELRFNYYLPKLNDYIKNTPQGKIDFFLKSVEGFSKDGAGENEPMIPRNNILFIGSLLNIESTLIRFDDNADNVADPEELLSAFEVYRSIILEKTQSSLHLLVDFWAPNELSKEEKVIFCNKQVEKQIKNNKDALWAMYYMVKYRRLPAKDSMIDPLIFVYFIKMKPEQELVPGDRLSIGALLDYLVKAGGIPPAPKFLDEILAGPDNSIPEPPPRKPKDKTHCSIVLDKDLSHIQ